MQQLGNKKTQVGGLVRREWLFTMPVRVRPHSSGATLVVAFLAALIGVSVLLLVLARLLLGQYETQTRAQPQSRVVALNQEAELLQKKVVGLVSGSIEAKLQAIESSLQQGRVSAADLQILDELRQELRILANYSANAQSLAADPMLVRGGIPMAEQTAAPITALDELVLVKNLFYVSIVTMGMASLLAAGYWLYHARQQRRLPSADATRPLLGRRRWEASENR